MSKETVEEAANRLSLRVVAYIPNPVINQDAKTGFIDGVKWQKEQSASEAIEFANWCEDNYWATGETNKWRAEPHLEETLTTKELYEIWKSQ